MRCAKPAVPNVADQQPDRFTLPLAVVPGPRPATETGIHGPTDPADAANVADEPDEQAESFSLPLAVVRRARAARAATGLSLVKSSAATVTSLLSQAGAPLLQKVFALLASADVVEQQSTGGLAGAVAQAMEQDSFTNMVKLEEVDDNSDNDKATVLLVLQQSFRNPVCHLKSLSALAGDLNLARSTLSRNKQAVACGITTAISVSWGCCLARVGYAIDSEVLKKTFACQEASL